MMTKKKNTTPKIFTSLMILYPLLGMYSLFGTPIMMPDFLMILFLSYIIINSLLAKAVVLKLETSFLPWTIYIFIHLIATLLLRNVSNTNDLIGSTFRYLLYLITIFLGSKNYFDVEYGIKVYKYVCIISTIFLIIQTIVSSLFGYYIKGYLDISFLPISRTELYEFGNGDVSQYAIFRPRSFFAEPAQYGTYICGYLAISLFKAGKKELPSQILLSLGALLSMSSLAILMTIGIWIMYVALNFPRKVSQRTLLVIFCIPIVFSLIINTTYFHNFIFRLFETNSVANRFDGYKSMMQFFDGNIFLFLFGYGVGGLQYEVFLAGYGKLLVSYGLLGTVILAANMISVFYKAEKWQRILVVVLLALQTGGGSLWGNMIMCFWSFICGNQMKTVHRQDSKDIGKNQYNL